MWISGNAKWISDFQCGFQEMLSGFQVSNVDFQFFRKSNPEHTVSQLQGNRQHQRDSCQSMTEIIKRLADFISKNEFNH